MSQTTWQKRAAAKVADTDAKIPPEWRISVEDRAKAKKTKRLSGPFIESFLSDEELSIVTLETIELTQRLSQRKLTCLQVSQAYCKTAAIAHQINNCLHEIFFDQALKRASELDQYFDQHGKPSGPLHGLPVSLKNQFHVKGVDTTMGYIGWVDTFEGHSDSRTHGVESQIVTDLLTQGAVVYCKTSLPQTLLCGETINNLIGQTLNPTNQGLSCGGSSGGEAALQALRGSNVGLGTDVGGSVRIPAAFCGLYSLKPTHNRLSYRDMANTNPGQLNYPSSVGVIGTSLESLKLVMSSLLSTEPWLRDPTIVPLPWRDVDVKQPLKIGMLFDDGYVTPHPPITRGLEMVHKVLVKAGHTVINWIPPAHQPAARIHQRFLKSDGGYDVHKQLDLSGEPLIPQLREAFKLVDPIDAIELQDLAI